MSSSDDVASACIKEADTLRRTLKRGTSRQVTIADERDIIKATALSWFNKHRAQALVSVDIDLLGDLDGLYKTLLSYGDRAVTRSRYDDVLKLIRSALLTLRESLLLSSPPSSQTSDDPPDFSPLVSDVRMTRILSERWSECCRCLNAQAPLAATVMMGGLLETLLLARFNREIDKSAIFSAQAAPKNKQTGKAAPLNEWALRHYIDVAHELGWISASAKDVGEVLRDYRNYVHPYKQLSHGAHLDPDDAVLFWEIAKNIGRQLISRSQAT